MTSLKKAVASFFLVCLLGHCQGLENDLRTRIAEAASRASNFIAGYTSATNEWHALETPSAILGLISANPARRETEESRNDVVALKEALQEIVLSSEGPKDLSAVDSSTLTQFISAFQTSCIDLKKKELGPFGGSALYQEARKRLRTADKRSPAIPGLALALCNDNLPIGPQIVGLLSLPQSRGRILCSSLCLEKTALNLLALTCIRRDPNSVWNRHQPYQELLHDKLEFNIGYLKARIAQSNYEHTLFDTVLLLQVSSVSTDFSLSEKALTSLYERILNYQKSDGSFGGSVTLTAMVIPALTNFTILDIGQRDCSHKAHNVMLERLNKGIRGPNDVLVTYTIEDVFSKSQKFVGDFSTEKGISLQIALNHFRILNKGIIDFETSRTRFGATLSSLMGIANSQVATWNVYRVTQDTHTKIGDLSTEVIDGDQEYFFKFEEVKAI